MARRYARDNKGRFASTGSGATARGGRLKTASGAKRQTQTMKAAGGRASTIGKPKGLKPGAIQARAAAKPAAKPSAKRKAVGSITSAKADRIIARIDANRPGQRRVAGSLRKSQNASRTHERATEFALGAAKRSIRRGKPIGTTESVRRAVANAANLNQRKLNRSKALQQRLATAATGASMAQSALSRRRKPAAKPVAKGRRQITSDKALRVSQRINNVTNAASSKTGVKRLNATEVGVRAKAFATRKVGGMSGTVGMNFQQQQAAVRAGLTKPPRYSTQKPNRNKPLRYNSLGQDSARIKAAQAAMTAREKIAQSNAAKPKPQSTAARTGRRGIGPRAVALPPANVPSYVTGRRVAGTIVKTTPPAKPSSTVARTRSQAKAVQRFRRNAILDRTRNWNGRNPGLKRSDTGMRQLSLAGPSKTLYSYKRTKLGRKPR